MIRFLTPLILIGIAITLYFVVVNPLYNDISVLKINVASLNEALDNSKALKTQQNDLTKKYDAISKDNLARIEKLLPDNVDNIRLILEIEKIAAPYGMVLKDIKYNTTDTNAATTIGANGVPVAAVIQGGTGIQAPRKDYGIWNLEFSTTGTYNNFINFTKALESNLRIVDISSIDFSSSDVGSNLISAESYRYNFKINTYWLKN